MASVLATSGAFSVRAHQGDAKTLLAFNLDKASARRPAGFPPGRNGREEPLCLIDNQSGIASTR